MPPLEVSAKDKETEILSKIVSLTLDKIHCILQPLHRPDVQEAIKQAIENLENDDSMLEETGGLDFKRWIGNLPILASLELDAGPAILIPHIIWASQARWVYSENIEDLFCPEGEELPVWINHIYKLGRYYVAAKAMLKLATKQPDLFTAIHVEAVEAPEQHKFSLKGDKTALKTVLQRLTKVDDQNLMTQLGRLWCREDPEAEFHKACNLRLAVHAEMQLLTFYDHHPEFTPRLLFMGTSKKACFLCHRFLSRHPRTISVSASHQKLYPSWMPAPCSASAVRKQHKVLLWELSRHLEQTAARDLETRLGVRRPNNMDSTAGPSMPTTESITSGQWSEYLGSTAESSLPTTGSTSSGRWTSGIPIRE